MEVVLPWESKKKQALHQRHTYLLRSCWRWERRESLAHVLQGMKVVRVGMVVLERMKVVLVRMEGAFGGLEMEC